jgi:hypothetical protein
MSFTPARGGLETEKVSGLFSREQIAAKLSA